MEYDAGQAVTVSQINQYMKETVAGDSNLRHLLVKGELSNFTNHQKTGHFYFTLKDERTSIRAVMFRFNAAKVRFRPENGMNVLITGSVQVFERDGQYQLYCDSMEPDGMGALYLAFEQLKEKLRQEGLFDEEHKKPLPRFPKRIGVVTSRTGAALQDIRNILSRRYPLGTLVVIPALVQGENAPASITEGIRLAEQEHLDVLIVGRGGGSIEDLWAFNDEGVAHAIYDCPIPVISAVGHEIDFTLSDFVADLRAPTPSAAAELCAPSVESISSELANLHSLLGGYMLTELKSGYDRLRGAYGQLTALSPVQRLRQSAQELEGKAARLRLAADRLVAARVERFQKAAATLEAMSPMKVITRGYSITYAGERLLSSVEDIRPGALLRTMLPDGAVLSQVTGTEQINRKDAE